jgi:membrane protein DedA with SNARE-associated domain
MHALAHVIAAHSGHWPHLGRHLHHRFAGPHADYVGLLLAAAVSWVGVTGPGEAALIAAGLGAAHGRVDIVGMLGVAWIGAMCGGTAGWMIGVKGGRALITKPGPLHKTRLRLVRHGDRVYERRGWLAVYLAPSWMAGVSGMPARRFVPANAVASLLWTLTIGLGAYLAGPAVADAIGDVGVAGLVALVAFAVISAYVNHRRLAHRRR